ncbi:HEAT repeat domain-containing protein, partial [Calothrix rhizosoleniae]|uniref:HEAT repeat domain-containing protein n=1 Tax=Calothrix rhizosoleniae TaxID=888997 RepID=UPI00117764F8
TALKDENSNIRRSAADALGDIGIDAKSAIAELTKIFLDKNEAICIRYRTMKSLAKIGNKEAVSVLKRYSRIYYYLREYEPGCECPLCRGSARSLRNRKTKILNEKVPVICRIPVIKNILKNWKCFDKKPDNSPQSRRSKSSSDTVKPRKNCSDCRDEQQ